MALHKFTPGGCRSNCETTNSCCPTGICTSPYTLYDLVLVRDGVPSASPIRLDTNIQTADCIWYSSSGVFTAQCGGVTMYGIANFSTSGGSTYLLVRVYDGPYPFTSANLLFWNVGSPLLLGASPADCGQTYSGGFTYTAAACSGYTWTFSLVPVAPECSTTGTTAGSGGSCCPCENCRVFRDSLTEFTAAEPNANWTEVRGDWRIEYGALRSGDANALLVANASASGGYDWRCVVMPYAAGAAAEFNLVFGYVDSNNYFVARWTYAGSQSDSSGDTLHLFQVDGGVESELTYTAEINQGTYVGGAGFVFAVCVNESRTRVTAAVRGDANLPILLTSAEVTPADVGNQFGFGPVTGGARAYGRPEASVVSADCEQCAAYVTCDSISGIAPCEGSLSPAEMLVTLPGGWVQPAPVGGYTGNACCPQWSAASVVAEFTSSIMPFDYGLATDPTARWYCLWLYEERMTSGETADAMGCTSYPVDRFFVILIPESAGGGLFRWHAYVRMQNANHKYTDVAEFRSDTFTIGEFDCRSSFTLAKYTVADEHPGDSLWSGQSYCDGAMSSPLLVEPVT